MLGGTPVSRTWVALRQRKVVQWTLAYLAGAWVVLQGLGLAAESYDWPHIVMRLSFGVMALGLIATLVLAWYHGERGQQKIRGAELLILTLLFVIGGGVLLRTERLGHQSPATQEPVNAAARSTLPAAVSAKLAVPATSTVPEKSIAVLPFVNLSEDKANAYFASGMQDEILTRLAGIRDLKVISRTSTAKYESHPDDLKAVGLQLGVATVLEGTVQKVGDAVHINVQLIDARTDGHLWAESYDRDLKDIFGVERDVAQKVAEALKAQLLPEEVARVAEVPTRDPEAYDLYLRAGAHANRAYDQNVLVPTEMPKAIALYEQALAKDPEFALAAAALAQAQMYMYFLGPDRSEARLASAKAAAGQALSAQPGLGEGHVALALYYYWGHRDYGQALQQLKLARIALPNSADVEFYFAIIARRQGQFDGAIAGLQRAAALDPHNSSSLDELGLTYSLMRRYAEADRAFARAAAVTANPADELVMRAVNTVAWKGELAPLRTALSSLIPGSDDYAANASAFFWFGWWSRDYPAAVKTAQADAADDWDDSTLVLPRQLYLAWAYTAAGDDAKAKAAYAAVQARMRAALIQRNDDPDLHMALGFADAGLGLKEQAVREGRRAVNLMPVSRDAISGAAHLGWLAQLYVRVGENDQALQLLQQLLAMPASDVVSPALLKLNPIWDPLRGDPRFQALLKKQASIEQN